MEINNFKKIYMDNKIKGYFIVCFAYYTPVTSGNGEITIECFDAFLNRQWVAQSLIEQLKAKHVTHVVLTNIIRLTKEEYDVYTYVEPPKE